MPPWPNGGPPGVWMISDGMVDRENKKIPVIIDLLIDVRRCQYAGFLPGHPIREALRDLIRIEQPLLAARIAEAKRIRSERDRKPVQMRLF